jgi:hypothetical protein
MSLMLSVSLMGLPFEIDKVSVMLSRSYMNVDAHLPCPMITFGADVRLAGDLAEHAGVEYAVGDLVFEHVVLPVLVQTTFEVLVVVLFAQELMAAFEDLVAKVEVEACFDTVVDDLGFEGDVGFRVGIGDVVAVVGSLSVCREHGPLMDVKGGSHGSGCPTRDGRHGGVLVQSSEPVFVRHDG